MSFGLLVATVDLYHIAETLEGVERETDGENEVCLVEEALVFEDEDDGEGGDDACHKPSLAMSWVATATLNHQRSRVVDKDGGEENKDVDGLEPHVEEAAGRQEPTPAPLVWKKVVDQRRHWEEDEEWE